MPYSPRAAACRGGRRSALRWRPRARAAARPADALLRQPPRATAAAAAGACADRIGCVGADAEGGADARNGGRGPGSAGPPRRRRRRRARLARRWTAGPGGPPAARPAARRFAARVRRRRAWRPDRQQRAGRGTVGAQLGGGPALGPAAADCIPSEAELTGGPRGRRAAAKRMQPTRETASGRASESRFTNEPTGLACPRRRKDARESYRDSSRRQTTVLMSGW